MIKIIKWFINIFSRYVLSKDNQDTANDYFFFQEFLIEQGI